jgi:DNA-binding CsgD family transcriptional regulator
MLPQAYLTDKQLAVWSLLLKDLSKAEVGRRLGVTRQAIYEAENIILGKVEQALTHAAEAGMIETRYMDPSKGILLGLNPSTGRKVIITFSSRNGVQTWHYEEPNCTTCNWTERCRRRLLDEAEEREVQLLPEEKGLPPSRLAHIIFSRVIPGLTP